MLIDRTTGRTDRTREIAGRVNELDQGCVGCSDCRGLCHELIEALFLPEAVLGKS